MNKRFSLSHPNPPSLPPLIFLCHTNVWSWHSSQSQTVASKAPPFVSRLLLKFCSQICCFRSLLTIESFVVYLPSNWNSNEANEAGMNETRKINKVGCCGRLSRAYTTFSVFYRTFPMRVRSGRIAIEDSFLLSTAIVKYCAVSER